MHEKLNIAGFVDYDNIERGVKSTLRREFDVALALETLKERGDIVAKFAYANWGRMESATRQMAENAVQMVQRNPTFRGGDKNGADINLALDALEMAFTHKHVNAFAIISGDSDFIPLVNKLKQYGKHVVVVGGKQFTSTILQQNCHEFISYEGLLDGAAQRGQQLPPRWHGRRRAADQGRSKAPRRERPAPLEIAQAMPLVERALDVLERRGVQPQLGLLKSTMMQLDATFSERAYGAFSFSDFVDRLKKADFVNVSGQGAATSLSARVGPAVMRQRPIPRPALPQLRDVLETHRLDLEMGAVTADELAAWVADESPKFDHKQFGFQQFGEFLVWAQDKGVVRVEPDEEKGMVVSLGAEFYPPAQPVVAEPPPPTSDFLEEGRRPAALCGRPADLDGPQPGTGPRRRARPPAKSGPRKVAGVAAVRRVPRRPAAIKADEQWQRRGQAAAPGSARTTMEPKPMIERLFPATVPLPKNPYSTAVKAGGFLYVSGQVPTDPATGEMSLGTIEHETALTLGNIQRILEGCGADLKQVVKVNVYLKNVGDFQAMNSVYRQYFPDNLPARTTVGVAFAHPEMKIEIDCVAYVGE